MRCQTGAEDHAALSTPKHKIIFFGAHERKSIDYLQSARSTGSEGTIRNRLKEASFSLEGS